MHVTVCMLVTANIVSKASVKKTAPLWCKMYKGKWPSPDAPLTTEFMTLLGIRRAYKKTMSIKTTAYA